MSIDLHVHSVNSDGTDSTEAIIESSIELQLEAICISDHEYLTKVPQQNKIEIIQGVEISVSWDLLDDTISLVVLICWYIFLMKSLP